MSVAHAEQVLVGAVRNSWSGKPIRWLATLLFASATMAVAQAESDLTSTNLDRLAHFWSAMEGSNAGPVTVLSFGDSMAVSYRSITVALFDTLKHNFGAAGFGLVNSWNAAIGSTEDGATTSSPDANWWTSYWKVPPGGDVFFTNYMSVTGSLPCDSVGVYWISHPAGGNFDFRVATNGGPWSEALLVLDGYSPAPAGHYTNVFLPRAGYKLRLDGLSGTNFIVGPQYLDRSSNRLNIVLMCEIGANLNQIFSLSTNVLYPILSAVNPQLVIWHMKELANIGETGLSNRLCDLDSLWKSSVTNGDIVYLGTSYESNDVGQEYTAIQNRLVRQAALRDGYAYVDCMNPCVSYQWMTNHGWLIDVMHLSGIGCTSLADVVWDQLGFFALREDRRLNMIPGSDVVWLEWQTSSNLTYQLQSSSDLKSWSALQTSPGDGTRQSYASAAGKTNVFFRLGISRQK